MIGIASGSSCRLDAAVEAYNEASSHATDPITRAAALLGVGENLMRKGDFEKALEFLDRALREIGHSRPTTLPGTLFGIWKSSIRVHLLPRFPSRSSKNLDGEKGLRLAFTASYLVAQMLASRNLLGYTERCYKLAALAKRTRSPEHRAVALSKFALNWALFGLDAVSRFYNRAAIKSVESRAHDLYWARTLSHVGTVHYLAGRLDEAEPLLLSTAHILDKLVDYYATFAHHFLRHMYAVRGDIPGELTEAGRERQLALARGDQEALGWADFDEAEALARAGMCDQALPLAQKAIDLMNARGALTEAKARQVLGWVQLQASDFTEARRTFEHTLRFTCRNLYFLEFLAPLYPQLPESLLGAGWVNQEGRPPLQVLCKARRECRTARLMSMLYPNIKSHALRVSGRAAFALGKPAKAARYFEQAIKAAEKLGARYDLARAYLDASVVVSDRSAEYRARGLQLLKELGAAVPAAEQPR
jgi:tetratricopeptide (TPR) repeat protein